MPLRVSYVERLEDILEPTREFLTRDGDLFARPRIVVPNAGTKAWLLGRLARELGATGGSDGSGERPCDGIVANVDISYPGAILSLLQPPRETDADSWDFDRLTFAVLDVLASTESRPLKIPFDVRREPLLAARRIAGFFDDYHVRRPEMILQWEGSTPSRAMNPTANDEQLNGAPVADLLPEQDTWQFELWRLVARRLAAPSPPARASLAHRAPHEPLLVAGLQSLSWPQLQGLERLAEACDVIALLVHPSPGLRVAWSDIGPQMLEEKLRGRPLRRSRRPAGDAAAPEAVDVVLPDGFDPLPATWLAGARDLQDMLAAQGIPVTVGPPAVRGAPRSLLHRMQATVASGQDPEPEEHDPAADHSVAIHRCHNLARQAEVLHDALLHAFADPDLAPLHPHEVVIVSPCLEEAAPHLEAVFQKTVAPPAQHPAAGSGRKIRLPLVVADRGLREASPAVDLLSRLVALPGSRCGVDDVLEVAGHPLVRPHLGIDDDTVKTWRTLVDRTQVRWGIDGRHRRLRGLEIGAPELHDVHTWKAGLEQMLLGATLPDDTPRPELGGVVPLGDLDPADVQPIARLVRVLDVVGSLATLAGEPRPTATWCDTIEAALTSLCGEQCRELTEPLDQLRRLREAATGAVADRVVAFDEVRELLAEWFDEQSGRQPLRTGAITATSMVPLRGVPFRVVCVVGYDDGAVAAPDPAKDDLVARMPLVGDVDPRIDGRRALLDCLLAARDRLVIMSTGRSAKTNEPVPLVTPLAELVDFAIRHGVGRGRSGDTTAIEIEHPRHHLAQRNFLAGRVQPGLIWSHDAVAEQVAAAAARRREEPVRPERRPGGSASDPQSASHLAAEAAAVPAAAVDKPEIDVSMLVRFAKDPLALYLNHSLRISTWTDDEEPIPATLPLELDTEHVLQLTLELVQVLATKPAEAADWAAALLTSGRLPLGPHGRRHLTEIEGLAAGIVARAQALRLPLAELGHPPVRIELPNARIVGRLEGVAPGVLATIKAGRVARDHPSRPLHVAAVRLLVARAMPDLRIDKAILISRNPDWSPGKRTPTGREVSPCQDRTVLVDATLDVHRRLQDLCDLLLESLASPHGMFGLHDTADGDRAEAFAAFVKARNWTTREWLYPTRPEAMVYGLGPRYAEVFAAGSPALSFLDRYRSRLSLQSKKGRTDYTLA